MTLTGVSKNKVYGGWQKVFSHKSQELDCDMKFGIFLPTKSFVENCSVIYWLSGLTCNEQNFIGKAGAQKYAEEYGVILVNPDTSPRNCGIEGEDESWDFGTGAGFYVDATEPKWKKHYRMFSYVTKELVNLVNKSFPTTGKQSIMGHSMGGHGALICYMKNPNIYSCATAFAPICNPIQCPWGVKAFTGYLGTDKSTWKSYDATELVKQLSVRPEIVIYQGSEDEFLHQKQLLPENFLNAAKESNAQPKYNLEEGYDHSYYFIASFIGAAIQQHSLIIN